MEVTELRVRKVDKEGKMKAIVLSHLMKNL